jgi:hypothetical protein
VLAKQCPIKTPMETTPINGLACFACFGSGLTQLNVHIAGNTFSNQFELDTLANSHQTYPISKIGTIA